MSFSKAFQTGTTLPRYSYTVILRSPIGRKWTSIGGLETTGRALSDPVLLEEGFGLMQMFVLGATWGIPSKTRCVTTLRMACGSGCISSAA